MLEQAIRPDTAIVSVMWANNETGVLFPDRGNRGDLPEQGRAVPHGRRAGAGQGEHQRQGTWGGHAVAFRAQAACAQRASACSTSRSGTSFQPYVIGGHQERGRRGGTENVANMVAFGRAAELALSRLEDENTRVRALRDRLEEDHSAGHSRILRRNGAPEPRLPNTSNIAFDFVEAEAVLMLLDQAGICASSGSACTTGSLDPSHVLTAMGLPPMRARGSLRFSLGFYNTEEEVDYLLAKLPPIIKKLRDISPLNPQHPDNAGYDVEAARRRHELEMARQ